VRPLLLAAGIAGLLAAAPAAAQLPTPPGGGGGEGGNEPPAPPPPAVAPGPPSDAWVTFGGDPAQRGATGDASIAPPFGVLWTAEFPDAVGALLVAEGRVFLGRFEPSTDTAVVEALDAATGARQWSVALPDRGSELAYGDGRVFAFDTNETLLALEAATGRELWRAHAGGSQRSGPVVSGDTVYVQGGAVTAFDVATGAKRWSAQLSSYHGDPAIVGDRLFATGGSKAVALDRRDGRVIWEHGEGGSSGGGATVVAAGDRVFPQEDVPVALSAATGQPTGGALAARVVGDVGITAVPGDHPGLVAHDLGDGRELWRVPAGSVLVGLARAFLTSESKPAPFHEHAGIAVRDARTGEALWRGRLLGDPRGNLRGGFRGYVAAGQGIVVFPSGNLLTALAPAARTRPEPVEAKLSRDEQDDAFSRYAAVLSGHTGKVLGAASVRIEATPFPFRAPMTTVAEVETGETGVYRHELRLRRNSRVRVVTNDGRVSPTVTKYVDPELKVLRVRGHGPRPFTTLKLRFVAPAGVRARGRLVGAYFNYGGRSRVWRRLDTARLGRGGTAWLHYHDPDLLPHVGSITFCLRGAHRIGLGRPIPMSRRCGARRYVQ
jgi:outer membrane protein assembly factor BamB